MSSLDAPTATSVLAAVTDILASERGGYRVVSHEPAEAWPADSVRVFEDPLVVAAVVVFDTWKAMRGSWHDAQAALVELLSVQLERGDVKAWDGYLVLLTTGRTGADHDELERIRYDTSQVRKLVADADDLATLADTERVLAPLLPLSADAKVHVAPRTALELLREDLVQRGAEASAVDACLAAFEAQESLLEALHRRVGR